VRANPTAAFAPGHFGWRIVEIRVVKWNVAATVATALEKLSVRVDNFPRTRLLVKAVHVLGADEKAFLQRLFKLGEGEVRFASIRIGFLAVVRKYRVIARSSFTVLLRMSSRAHVWPLRCNSVDLSAFGRLPVAFGPGANGASP
jgi:hypothetical protein